MVTATAAAAIRPATAYHQRPGGGLAADAGTLMVSPLRAAAIFDATARAAAQARIAACPVACRARKHYKGALQEFPPWPSSSAARSKPAQDLHRLKTRRRHRNGSVLPC